MKRIELSDGAAHWLACVISNLDHQELDEDNTHRAEVSDALAYVEAFSSCAGGPFRGKRKKRGAKRKR